MCNCKTCAEHREFRAKVAELPAEQRPYFEALYEELHNVRADKNYADVLIDGSWPTADKIITFRREQLAVKLAERAISAAARHPLDMPALS